jgi:hypothetical protein
VELLSDERGREVVVDVCVALLAGRDVDGYIVYALGGPPARWTITGGAPGPQYWLRVWALRGLLWVWDDRATSAVVNALTDGSWRVREMAAKVAARHLIDDSLDGLLALREDPVPRVRAAASRAIEKITVTT